MARNFLDMMNVIFRISLVDAFRRTRAGFFTMSSPDIFLSILIILSEKPA